jgi:transcriptional regulator with XRE-family HTH domain
MSTVSQNIKYLRISNGYTQEQFATLLNIKRSRLGSYEEARATPNFECINTITKLFGISMEQFMHESLNTNTTLATAQHKVQTLATQDFKTKTSPSKTFVNTEPNLFSDQNNPVSLEASIESSLLPAVKYPESIPTKLAVNNVIGYVAASNLMNFINSGHLQTYLNQLPEFKLGPIQLQKGFAFDATPDLGIGNAIVITEELAKGTSPENGAIYVVITKTGQCYTRRLFDISLSKGCYILSSDVAEFTSIELPVNQLYGLYKVQYTLCTSIPKSEKLSPRIHQLLLELQDEIAKNK